MDIKDFHKICETLKDIISGTEFDGHVYCVGGCIRDEILERPVKDIDIAVDLPNGGIRLAEWLYEQGRLVHEPVTFTVYSTAQFVLKEYPEMELEAVQTRKEKYEDRSNRNPVTAYGTIEEDCLRRDLTINSLYKNISTGEILDIIGKGMDDIHNKIIRTPVNPDETFDDDPLRMLRCIRFATRSDGNWDWKIEPDTWAGIIKNADRLKIITRERIHDELFKMLETFKTAESIWLMAEAGLMEYVFGIRMDLNDCVGIYNSLTNIYNYGSVMAKLSVIMFHLRKYGGNIEEILRGLKCSNVIIKTVNIYLEHRRQISTVRRDDTEARLRSIIYSCGSYHIFSDCLVIHQAIYPKDDYKYESLYNQYDKDDEDGIDLFSCKVPVNGDDIMRELNIEPGKTVKVFLDLAFKLFCENPRISKKELIEELKKCPLNVNK